MFRDRWDAGHRLAVRLKQLGLKHPVVLGIPRGGVVPAVVLAEALGGELDVVLSRKLRAPQQPELALGAIAETGDVYLNEFGKQVADELADYLDAEKNHQLKEIARRQTLFRGSRAPVPLRNRTVVVTDDGIATGSTMIAALETIRLQHPQKLIVAVPVASPDRLAEIRGRCDEIVCLDAPRYLMSIGEFYEDFRPIEDEEVVALLRGSIPCQTAG